MHTIVLTCNPARNRLGVWRGAQILKVGGYRHVLMSLSRGGADASVKREFDLKIRTFVKGGFELPEAKSGTFWIDKDHVYVRTDFGRGSMTTSGYPRIVKRWTSPQDLCCSCCSCSKPTLGRSRAGLEARTNGTRILLEQFTAGSRET